MGFRNAKNKEILVLVSKPNANLQFLKSITNQMVVKFLGTMASSLNKVCGGGKQSEPGVSYWAKK